MSTPARSLDLKAMAQELRANPKTQVALGGFVLALGLLMYTAVAPDAPKARRGGEVRGGGSFDSRQLQGLAKLPDLAALDKAGELPPKPKVLRDLFMFEAPPLPPKPAPPAPPPVPPPPPTAEELERQALTQAKNAEFAGRPQDLRYLGFFKGTPSGLVGAFMRGEEAVTLTVGALAKERWRLVAVQDTRAEFQNTKYPDLKLVLEARDGTGGSAAVTNQF